MSAPFSLVAADLTGDGRTDLVSSDASSSGVSVLLGHGDGTFQLADQYGLGTPDASVRNYDIVAGDFNGDGRNDLAVLNGNEVDVLLGNGDGTFQPATEYALAHFTAAQTQWAWWPGISAALASSTWSSADIEGVQILLGNGDGTFQPAETVAPVADGFLVAGDFTGDGRLDLAVASNTVSDTVSVLVGNGDGTFQAPDQYAVANPAIGHRRGRLHR